MPTNPGTELAALDFGNLIGGPLCAVIEAQTRAARATADFIKSVGFDQDFNPIYVAFKYPKEVQPYQPGKTFFKVSSISIVNAGTGYTTAPTITFSPPNDGETAAIIGTVTVASGAIATIPISSNGKYISPPAITVSAPDTAGTQAEVKVVMEQHSVESSIPAVYQEMKIEVPILTILPIPFIRIEKATLDFNAKINSMETSSQSTDMAIAGSLEVQQRWPSGRAKLTGSASFQKKTASGSTVERTYSMHIFVEATQDEMPAGMEKLLNLLEGAMMSTPGNILPPNSQN